jgi:hypothetical protein
MKLERAFGIRVSDEEFGELKTVSAVVDLVERKVKIKGDYTRKIKEDSVIIEIGGRKVILERGTGIVKEFL